LVVKWEARTASLAGHGSLTATAVPVQTGIDVEDMRRRSDLTEARVAKRLGIDADALIRLSWRLWEGHTFGEERDRRAVNPARRGQVSRELQAELRKALTDGDD
jgi:hypothetical protein